MEFLDQLEEAEKEFKQKEVKKNLDKGKQYKIKTQQYCGLSREKKWQEWLGKVAPDLLIELHEHFKQGSGCKKNKLKMEEIQEKLVERKLSKNLILFLNENYPHVID